MGTRLSLKQIADIDNIPAYIQSLMQLEVQDNNITINKPINGSNTTNNKSLGSGFTVRYGDGVDGDVTLQILSLNTITNSDEYDGTDGVSNRGWFTELSDIVVNYNSQTNTGNRVITEDDIIDGGEY